MSLGFYRAVTNAHQCKRLCLEPHSFRQLRRASQSRPTRFPQSPRVPQDAAIVHVSRENESDSQDHTATGPPRLWPQASFCLLASGFAVFWAAFETEKSTAELQHRLAAYRAQTLTGQLFGAQQPEHFSSSELATARRAELHNYIRGKLATIKRQTTEPIYRAFALVGEKYARWSEARVSCAHLVAVQGVIFLAWQLPSLGRFMSRNFLAWPWGRMSRSYQVLTATFSHQAIWHIGFNSIAFMGFGASVHEFMSARHLSPDTPPSATSRYEFLAFFVAAGMFAGLASHCYSRFVRFPRMLTAFATRASASPPVATPSLGASGAIWACLSFCAVAFPDRYVQIIFLPGYPFPIGTAVLFTAAIDFAGLLRGWRFFDHAAHLGGAVFGVLYFRYGSAIFDRLRDWLRGSVHAAVKHAHHSQLT